MKQSSKESAYKEFYATFGSNETQSSKTDSFVVDPSHHSSNLNSVKAMRKEIDQCLASVTKLNVSGHKHRHPEGAEQGSEKFAKQAKNEDVLKIKNKKLKQKNNYGSTEYAASNKEPSQGVDKMEKKRCQKDGLSKSLTKKLKG